MPTASGDTARAPAARAVLDPQLIAERAARKRRRRLVRRLAVLGSRLALFVALVAGWQYLGETSPFWRSVIASPAAVWTILLGWMTDPSWWQDVAVTTQETAIGYLLGAAVALVLVVIVVPIPAVDRFVSPFIAAVNALPKLLLFPLFIVWFGLGPEGKQYFVASIIFSILFYGVHTGVRSIDRNLIDNCRVLGASTLQLVGTVYVPAVAAWLIVSMRVAISVSLLGAVIGEFLGSFAGIGRRIAEAQSLARVDIVLAAVIFVAIVALVIDRILVRVQRRYTSWSIF